MMETLKIGLVECQFLRRDDFLDYCEKCLEGDKLHHVVTLNPEMVVQAKTDKDFKEAMERADIKVPDGAGIIWARWFIRSKFWSLFPSLLAFPFIDVERITGIDALVDIAKLCQEKNKDVYLLGGTHGQRAGAVKFLKEKFPSLTVHQSIDHDFDLNGGQEIIDDIKEKQPAVIFVAYGAPKQTLWIEKNRERISNSRIAMGVGGAFAMLSEEKKRAPKFFRRLNLEWLWRLILEPNRLPRIWQAVVEFPQIISQQKRSGKIEETY